jgi:hypothetical protein
MPSDTLTVPQDAAAKDCARPPRKNLIRKKPHVYFRGVPPLPTFDLAKLAPSQIMTQREVAAAVRRSVSTLASWRQENPDHPLRWEKRHGRVIYRVRDVRKYLGS